MSHPGGTFNKSCDESGDGSLSGKFQLLNLLQYSWKGGYRSKNGKLDFLEGQL